jgi:hypothetical protein
LLRRLRTGDAGQQNTAKQSRAERARQAVQPKLDQRHQTTLLFAPAAGNFHSAPGGGVAGSRAIAAFRDAIAPIAEPLSSRPKRTEAFIEDPCHGFAA